MRSPEAFGIYSACMYRPTPEKYAALAEELLTNAGVRCFGAYQGGSLLGIIAVRGGEIIGIAVRSDARSRGVGRALIGHARKLSPALTAETDADAVGFYRHCGFVCEAFERSFPDGACVRWRCTLQ